MLNYLSDKNIERKLFLFIFLISLFPVQSIIQAQTTITICNGDSVLLYNNWETQNGIYTDGITTTTLIVNPTPTLTGSFILNGSATQPIPNTYDLTQAIGGQSGSAWNSVTLNLTQPFSFDVDLFFGNNNSGADGIAFLLQQVSTSVGSSGGGIGYQGITPSLGVEFDTWYNSGWNQNDPSYDHIAIQKNGDLNHNGTNNLFGPIGFPPGNANIEDGIWHNVIFSWDPTTFNFQVFFDGILLVNYNNNIVDSIFGNNPNVYWGFTAATGGANNHQRFRVNSLGVQLSNENICQNDSIEINPQINSSLYTYLWLPNYNVTNNTTSTNFFSPDTTTVYSLQVTNSYGCSFTDSLTIFVNAPTSDTTNITECDSYTWPVNGNTYNTSGTYNNISTNSAGCTHTDTLNLIINNSSSNTSNITECDSYTWAINGNTYNTSGIYTDINGCHTETLNLTINSSTSNTSSVTQCDSYTWTINGNTYTTSGAYTDINGCHTEILNLTINNSSFNTINITECDAYTWAVDGNTYTTSGTYTDINGCHTEILNLIINNSTSNTSTTTACDTYNWSINGNIYNTSDIYTYINGCHTEILELTINNSTSNTTTTTACDSYTWAINNQIYSASNTYAEISTNPAGCMHTETLNLTIGYTDDINLTIDATPVSCFNEDNGSATINVTGGIYPYTYLWSDGQTTNPAISLSSGAYSCVISDAIGCQVDTAILINEANEIFLDFIATSPICRYEESTLSINITNSTLNTYTISLLDSVLKSFVIDTNGLLIPEGVKITLTPNFSGQVVIISLTDNEGCTRIFNDDVHIEVKQLPQLAINENNLCVGEKSYELNNATPNGGTYFINDIITNYFDVENLPIGDYDIKYEYTDSTTMCSNQIIETITINESPEANILVSPQPTDINNANILFRDNSNEDIVMSEWHLGDGTIIYDEENFWHTYNDTGRYTIKYYISNIYSCTDSVIDELTINPIYSTFIPDAFSPNNDGNNDYFYPSIIGGNSYNMKIYDRWGGMIYNKENNKWDGTINGKDIPNGIYSYSISVFDFNNRVFVYTGILNLLR